jgi:hypothetical protein
VLINRALGKARFGGKGFKLVRCFCICACEWEGDWWEGLYISSLLLGSLVNVRIRQVRTQRVRGCRGANFPGTLAQHGDAHVERGD